MSMHLHHPSLTTTGKRKGKQKWASSEAKKKAEQLDKEWQDLQKKWGVEQEERKRKRAMSSNSYQPPKQLHRGSDEPKIPSLITTWAPCTRGPDTIYTGTKIIGIGTMHKSNAVPIFSDEEAKSIAKMRR